MGALTDRLLAFDPGGTTGVSVYLREGDRWRVAAWETDSDDAANTCWVWLESGRITAVATESFSIRSGTPVSSATSVPIALNGVFRFIASRFGAPLLLVPPTSRAGAVKRIRAVGTGWAGPGDHAHDAQAVGLVATQADPAAVAVQTGGARGLGWDYDRQGGREWLEQ